LADSGFPFIKYFLSPVYCMPLVCVLPALAPQHSLLTDTKKKSEADEAGQNNNATKNNMSNSSMVYNAAKREDASVIECCKEVKKSMHLVHKIPTQR
jgi:hypothetical protein